MDKYRKKPVVVEAMAWDGGDTAALERFLGLNWGRADAHDMAWPFPHDKEEVVIWNSLEKSWRPCPTGYWVIRGVKGEFYPCDGEAFQQTYEPAE